MQYRVRAIDAARAIQTLELDAYDEADARQQALARQLTPLSVARGALRAGHPQRRFALLLFAQELLALLNAGLSVIEALEALVEKDADAARRAVLSRLATQLREGHRLSAAMLRQPEVFPPLFVGIVQAAENTSDLPRALARYLDYEARAQAVRHKVVSAAILCSRFSWPWVRCGRSVSVMAVAHSATPATTSSSTGAALRARGLSVLYRPAPSSTSAMLST